MAGQAFDPSIGSAGFALARYQPNGTLDTTFGGDGRVITTSGAIPWPTPSRCNQTAKLLWPVMPLTPLTPQLVFAPALPWRAISRTAAWI